MTDVTETPALDPQAALHLHEQLTEAGHTIEVLTEALADIELSREDFGWRRIGFYGETQFTRAGLRNSAKLCRVMAVANPLLKRGLSLRSAYVWGEGVEIQARATGPTSKNTQQQDVNGYIQQVLDDPEWLRTLFGALARQRNERTLGTDGTFFLALITNRATGWVRPRTISSDEIDRVISNPEDKLDRWFFLREWTELVTEPGSAPDTTRQRRQTKRVLFPSIDYRPTTKPSTYGGLPIEWDSPVVELNVNDLDGWDFGIGDAFAVLPFVKAYTEFLTDWAKIVKALSRFAFRASAPTRTAAQRAAQTQAQANDVPPPRGDRVGATVHQGPGQTLEAIPKSGATIDSESGRPLAAMVAAGLEVPVTMLLGDPGVTGARATAETLDRPTELMAIMRRDVWTEFLRRVFDYVIDQAAKAPGGPLRRKSITRDKSTNREIVTLAGDTDRTIEIVWPDLTETPLKDMLAAIESADGMDKVPPLEILKLILHAFKIDDVDEILEQVTDAQGRFVAPEVTAGTVATDAFRNGEDPAQALK